MICKLRSRFISSSRDSQLLSMRWSTDADDIGSTYSEPSTDTNSSSDDSKCFNHYNSKHPLAKPPPCYITLMTEASRAVAAAVGLAAASTACVDCFEYVQSRQPLARLSNKFAASRILPNLSGSFGVKLSNNAHGITKTFRVVTYP